MGNFVSKPPFNLADFLSQKSTPRPKRWPNMKARAPEETEKKAEEPEADKPEKP